LCPVRFHARFTRKTIEAVFPTILGNEMLTQKLIGKEIVYPIDIRFYFDENGKVTKFQGDVDFVTA
jgi:hypothetical protein